MSTKKRIYRLLFLLSIQYVSSFAQTFDCDASFYLALASDAFEAPVIHKVIPGENNAAPSFDILSNEYDLPFNSIGYNVRDQLIYGLNPENYHIYRINAFGAIEDLGIPDNLNTTEFEYYAGAFNPTGRTLYLIGRDKATGLDKSFFSIRFDAGNLSAGFLSLLSDDGTRLEDIAFDPEFGTAYGFDSLHKRIVTIDLTSGAISTYVSSSVFSVDIMGSLFFDEQGDLYAYGSGGSSENTLYKIDKFERTILERYTGPSGFSTDGCACPYRIKFYKKPSSQKVLPCSEMTMTYHTVNTAGTTYTNIELKDSFPPEFMITEIIKPPSFGIIESGVGTNKLQITNMDVLLGQDSVVIKIAINENAQGGSATHASIDNFPMALGPTILSDNHRTATMNDATLIEVVRAEGLLDVEETFLCESASLTLSTELIGMEYLWSDGSTEASTEVDAPGWYWLEVFNDCVFYRDSILIEQVETPLFVDLGDDLNISLGDLVPLSFHSNAQTDIDVTWQSTEEENSLTCLDCMTSSIQPISNTTITLSIEDAYGCTAFDEINVLVEKRLDVYAPNIFTPNFDGNNDSFYLQGRLDLKIKKFQIYNRWGAVVHEVRAGMLNDATYAWDGTYKKKKAKEGVYIWIATIIFADGSEQFLKGDISLVR